jgi:hypothetical protein
LTYLLDIIILFKMTNTLFMMLVIFKFYATYTK